MLFCCVRLLIDQSSFYSVAIMPKGNCTCTCVLCVFYCYQNVGSEKHVVPQVIKSRRILHQVYQISPSKVHFLLLLLLLLFKERERDRPMYVLTCSTRLTKFMYFATQQQLIPQCSSCLSLTSLNFFNSISLFIAFLLV